MHELLMFFVATGGAPQPVSAETLQFDLDCTGTETSNFGSDEFKTRPLTFKISVDVTQELYALPFFKSPKKIKLVRPNVIVFEDESGSISQKSLSVDRVTGEFVKTMFLTVGSDSKKLEATGFCKVAPFTTLPKTLF